jgi:uncharacterized protein YfcZ (UPF0381/DUF406 family)
MKTRQTAAGIAMAVEVAGLLMSPETAAELARLRAERDGAAALSPAGAEYVASIRARHAAIEGAGWHLAPEPHVEPGTVRTMVGGYQRVVGVFEFRGAPATADANREFVLYAASDVGFLLDQMDRLHARVAELLAERHSTNEALSEVAEAVRAKDARVAELEAERAELNGMVRSSNQKAADALAEAERLRALLHDVQRIARDRMAEAQGRRQHGETLTARITELEQQLTTARGAVAEAFMCPDEDCNGHLPKIERALGGLGLLADTEGGERS